MEEKKSAREVAINYFLDEIKYGNLKPGDKILNERKLSEKLGISRIPLREAISTLSTLGILEAYQGNGTYVSVNSNGILASIIRKYGIFNRSMIDEVFEARILFEADAAMLAAKNRTDDNLRDLKEALSQHENALASYFEGKTTAKQMMEYDNKIHLAIAVCAHNNFILQITEAIRYVTMEHGFFNGEFTINREHFKQSATIHREIATAIEKQNSEEAYRKMQEHIKQISSALDLEMIRRKENEELS